MKLMIRNTSRDKTTAALRKARPGDVQPFPMIKKVLLPPGGSLHIDSLNLSHDDALQMMKLVGCGCLRVFTTPGYGPMRALTEEEILELAPAQAAPAPAEEPAPAPAPAPEPEPEPEPVAESEEMLAEPVAESDENLIEDSADEEEQEPEAEQPAYLKSELKAMKNADLRAILTDMGHDRTTGMNKSALVAQILELQES